MPLRMLFSALLTSTICEGAQKAESLSSACIYRVPKNLRKMNESAYTPRLIAIGPLHRNDPHLQTHMQHVKTSYMNNLLCRMTEGMENQEVEQKKILQGCVAEMEMLIEYVKKFYAEEVALDAIMMLVDGCFILEFLYRLYLYHEKGIPESEVMTIDSVQHDLILLENQIPFLVLKRLFLLTLARIPNKLGQENLSLTDFLFLPTVAYSMPSQKSTVAYSLRPAKENSTNRGSEKTTYYHILHKMHDYLVPDYQTVHRYQKARVPIMLPSASELFYAGVKFVPATGNGPLFKFTESKGPIWWFRSARLDIPTLRIVKSTELLLRNFIAFEQYCPGISKHYTSYAYLMDMLVKSDIDVQVLENAGVVHNWMGTRKIVTNLFNNLCQGVEIREFLFADICYKAAAYNDDLSLAKKNIADLKRQYFSSPWKFIGLCVAIVYFFITIAQLIVSICVK